MSDLGWYAVRCVFGSEADNEDETTYEERITLWQATSADEAIERAEVEALAYAASIEEVEVNYLGLAQCFHLFDDPSDGAEIFSLMRDSELEPDDYLDTFFDSGDERTSHED
ncbi:DUF4288 domain-containing protein [Nocardioides marmoriginsengisoli]|uniref:DUF4288 domain-containing protein n=1 Tax=Nocardioides marmoriginsengisoli TaxID=661483 RepID=A0A3N0CMP1_9ACTN|nr:DUF4288 domain-containing protein [Nocardioides marmoriginsengisoli]RNL64326.1 DUF4288 domain-containing protein [Nocardioides marmoriginsengisoli]